MNVYYLKGCMDECNECYWMISVGRMGRTYGKQETGIWIICFIIWYLPSSIPIFKDAPGVSGNLYSFTSTTFCLNINNFILIKPSVSRDNDTVRVRVGESSGHVIRTYQLYYQLYLLKMKKILNSNNNRSKRKFLRLLWNIVVFRFVAYLLNMIFLKLRFLYQILYLI